MPLNLDVFETLGERWYTADDDPIALLRAESRLLAPWIAQILCERFARPARVLDVGCGGGFLSNALAGAGFDVTGVDRTPGALDVARRFDSTGRVAYQKADAEALPFGAGSFDAVAMMDFLEHVQDPHAVIAEASRVLRPGGCFFFHTFSRNPLAWLVVIRGVEWFVRNTPKNLHLYRYFIRPEELAKHCHDSGLEPVQVRGTAPKLGRQMLRLLRTGCVDPNFEFRFTALPWISYAGFAQKPPLLSPRTSQA